MLTTRTKPHIVSLTVNLDNDTIDTLLHSLWNGEDEPLDLQAGHVDLCKSTPSSEACVLGSNEWAGFASLRCSVHTVGGEEEADMGILPIEFHVRSLHAGYVSRLSISRLNVVAAPTPCCEENAAAPRITRG